MRMAEPKKSSSVRGIKRPSKPGDRPMTSPPRLTGSKDANGLAKHGPIAPCRALRKKAVGKHVGAIPSPR